MQGGAKLPGASLGGKTMLTFLDRYQEHTYALLRMVTGFLFIWHGTQKLFGFLAIAARGAGILSIDNLRR
jgi:uncharacterized membrane protein YphA (DoxX/SURF4 family)